MAAGPDGKIWYTDDAPGHVGKMSPLNPSRIIEYVPAGTLGRPGAITQGSDGRMWFAARGPKSVGAITTTGNLTLYGSGTRPVDLVLGNEGDVRFADANKDRIGRVTPSGAVSYQKLPSAIPFGKSIVAGPDGDLWVTTDSGSTGIVKLGVTGSPSTRFSVSASPTSGGEGAVTVGPDGNIWFARPGSMVVRVTPSGVVTEFPLTAGSDPEGIVSGPDGNLWVTDREGPAIFRVATDGSFTRFALPGGIRPPGDRRGSGRQPVVRGRRDREHRTDHALRAHHPFSLVSADAGPNDIAAGPDGNLWFTDYFDGSIGRITPTGAVTIFPSHGRAPSPSEITLGPDGNMWFTNQAPGEIGRITPAGVIKMFDVPRQAQVLDITVGSDGALWFTEQFEGRIGRITTG